MTAPPVLIDAAGRPFPLDRPLASGGEGAVFTLPADPTRVAKVYHRPPNAQTVEKLAAMTALVSPRLLELAAWPAATLHDARTRAVAGFVMPRVVDGQPVQHLYNPVQRLRSFPTSGWRFQVRAAYNLAAAFDEVHKAGCLVGDVNQSNAYVSPQALVRLIDCDSFQVRANGRQYLCEVGVPHYTPPELQGASLRGLVRTENHDRFGLAVLIYQLLFVGRHPYAGVYSGAGDPPFDQLIREFRFAQGPAARTWGMSPPPHTPTFADIPADMGDLFRRAFERGGERDGARPRPAEWLTALKRLEGEIATCRADAGHTYWKGAAGGCVWCRLAANGGPEYYYGVAGGVGTFAVDEAKLRDVSARLAAAGPVDFRYDRNRFAPAVAPTPRRLPDGLDAHRSTAAVLGLGAGFCLLMMPFGAFHTFFAVLGALGALTFGFWLGALLVQSPWYRERQRRQSARDRAAAHLRGCEDEWADVVEQYGLTHADHSAAVRGLVAACRGLAAAYQDEVRRLTGTAEALARTRHLRMHLIADAEIPTIGAKRRLTLAGHGVTTAADIDEDRIRGIPGFGDIMTAHLLAWRHTVLGRFRFDPATAVSPADIQATVVRFRGQEKHHLTEIGGRLAALEALAPACRAELQGVALRLRAAVAAWEQAAADLRLFTARR